MNVIHSLLSGFFGTIIGLLWNVWSKHPSISISVKLIPFDDAMKSQTSAILCLRNIGDRVCKKLIIVGHVKLEENEQPFSLFFMDSHTHPVVLKTDVPPDDTVSIAIKIPSGMLEAANGIDRTVSLEISYRDNLWPLPFHCQKNIKKKFKLSKLLNDQLGNAVVYDLSSNRA